MTLVPLEFCQELAKGLRAEKITQRLYRLLPPDSACSLASEFHNLVPEREEQFNLASGMELPGLRYIPSDPARRRAARHADAIAAIQEYQWA